MEQLIPANDPAVLTGFPAVVIHEPVLCAARKKTIHPLSKPICSGMMFRTMAPGSLAGII